ncbi:MAG: zf-HC2 domain-containing protein [Chloroflexota bacterium]
MQSPRSKTCQELIAQLSDFLDGELDAALCEKIERHLATCHACRVAADTLRKTIALYHGARVAVPREAHAHLVQVLGIESAAGENAKGRPLERPYNLPENSNG